MYKYTPCEQVVARYKKTPWNKVYFLALEICRTPNAYFTCGDFWRHYLGLSLYSPEKLDRIPVNGVLLDKKWFKEERV